MGTAFEVHQNVTYAGPERRQRDSGEGMELVVLRKKFAEELNGIALGEVEVGDRLALPAGDADLLVAEGWATHVPYSALRERCDQEVQKDIRR